MCYRFVPDVKNEKIKKIQNILICANPLPYLSSGFLWANWEFPRRKVGISSLQSPTFLPGKSKSPFWLILMATLPFFQLNEMFLRFDVTLGSGLILCYNHKTAAEISPTEAIFLCLTLFKGGQRYLTIFFVTLHAIRNYKLNWLTIWQRKKSMRNLRWRSSCCNTNRTCCRAVERETPMTRPSGRKY